MNLKTTVMWTVIRSVWLMLCNVFFFLLFFVPSVCVPDFYSLCAEVEVDFIISPKRKKKKYSKKHNLPPLGLFTVLCALQQFAARCTLQQFCGILLACSVSFSLILNKQCYVRTYILKVQIVVKMIFEKALLMPCYKMQAIS